MTRSSSNSKQQSRVNRNKKSRGQRKKNYHFDKQTKVKYQEQSSFDCKKSNDKVRINQRTKRSWVWNHFQKTQNRQTLKCSRCDELITFKYRNLANAKTHIQQFHNQQYQNQQKDKNQYKSKHLNSNENINKLIAKNLMNFSQISSLSQFQQDFSCFKIPKTCNQVSEKVFLFYQKIKQMMKRCLNFNCQYLVMSVGALKIQKKEFMSLALYFNKNSWNIGLIRQRKNITIQQKKKLIQEKIESFGLNLKKIKIIVTNSKQNNKSFANEFKKQHVMCLSHMMQKSVNKLLKFKIGSKYIKNIQSNYQHYQIQQNQSYISDSDFQSSQTSSDSQIEIDYAQATKKEIGAILKKVRFAIKKFHSSNLSNEQQKQFSIQNLKKMKIDNSMGWQSCRNMINSYLLNHDQLVRLSKKRQQKCAIQQNQKLKFEELQQILNLAFNVGRYFERQQASIIHAQEIIYIWLQDLNHIQNSLSKQFQQCLIKYYGKYRNVRLISLGLFLKDKQKLEDYKQKGIFKYLQIAQIQKFIKEMFTQEFQNSQSKAQQTQIEQKTEIIHNLRGSMLKIENVFSQNKYLVKRTQNQLQNQIQIYKRFGQKGRKLYQIQDLLNATPPRSGQNDKGSRKLLTILEQNRNRLKNQMLQCLYVSHWYWAKGKQIIMKIKQ